AARARGSPGGAGRRSRARGARAAPSTGSVVGAWSFGAERDAVEADPGAVDGVREHAAVGGDVDAAELVAGLDDPQLAPGRPAALGQGEDRLLAGGAALHEAAQVDHALPVLVVAGVVVA